MANARQEEFGYLNYEEFVAAKRRTVLVSAALTFKIILISLRETRAISDVIIPNSRHAMALLAAYLLIKHRLNHYGAESRSALLRRAQVQGAPCRFQLFSSAQAVRDHHDNIAVSSLLVAVFAIMLNEFRSLPTDLSSPATLILIGMAGCLANAAREVLHRAEREEVVQAQQAMGAQLRF
jgi:hypothetical protein